MPIDVVYENVRIEAGLRADLIVEGRAGLGLLLNFSAPLMKDGISRIANNR